MRYETSVTIDAQPAAVWAALTDIEHWPELTASITSVRLLQPGKLAVGVEAQIRQPKLPPTTWRVTELEPEVSFTWIARAPGVVTTAGHVLTAEAGGGVTVLLSVEHRGPLAPVVHALTGRLTRRYMGMEAAGLKSRAEADVEAGS